MTKHRGAPQAIARFRLGAGTFSLRAPWGVISLSFLQPN